MAERPMRKLRIIIERGESIKIYRSNKSIKIYRRKTIDPQWRPLMESNAKR